MQEACVLQKYKGIRNQQMCRKISYKNAREYMSNVKTKIAHKLAYFLSFLFPLEYVHCIMVDII